MPTLTADTFTLCAILDGFDPQRDTQMKLGTSMCTDISWLTHATAE